MKGGEATCSDANAVAMANDHDEAENPLNTGADEGSVSATGCDMQTTIPARVANSSLPEMHRVQSQQEKSLDSATRHGKYTINRGLLLRYLDLCRRTQSEQQPLTLRPREVSQTAQNQLQRDQDQIFRLWRIRRQNMETTLPLDSLRIELVSTPRDRAEVLAVRAYPYSGSEPSHYVLLLRVYNEELAGPYRSTVTKPTSRIHAHVTEAGTWRGICEQRLLSIQNGSWQGRIHIFRINPPDPNQWKDSSAHPLHTYENARPIGSEPGSPEATIFRLLPVPPRQPRQSQPHSRRKSKSRTTNLY